jgi:pseudouridine synthase
MKERLTLERLNRFLARAGVGSRRACDRLIEAGKVTVNGERVDAPGTRVDPTQDRVTCGGQEVRPPDTCTYVLLNKPRGYLVSAGDPHHDRTIFELLDGVVARVFPVGRLDMDTGGALILTDDGDLAYRLMHPRYEVDKTYRVGVASQPSGSAIRQLRDGVTIEGRRTFKAAVRVIGSGREGTEMEIVIHEGRNRQVRKMFEAVGSRVLWLERSAFGGITVDGLARGEWRSLTDQETAGLRSLVGLESAE